MAFTTKRIIALPSQSEPQEGDYLAIDNAQGGTHKIPVGSVGVEVDDTLTEQGKAADAKATGDALDEIRPQVVDLKSDINNLIVTVSYTESDGYFNDSGSIHTPTDANEKYTSKIPVVTGEKLDVIQAISASRSLWIAYCLYDSSQTIVGYRETLVSQIGVSAGATLTIPDGISYVAFCYRTYSSSELTTSVSIKKYFDEEYIGSVAEQVIETQSANRRLEALEGLSFPFAYSYVYHHMFMDNVDSAKTIPPQSIWDVQVAHRLGFQFIEANVHATATDGKYVVTHGDGGKLGGDFETIGGGDASTIVIADTSFDDLRANYRYKSIYSKYKGPITSLEEFLYQCKSLNIYPVLGYVDDTELEIAQNIVGNNMILYGGSRSVFKGFIMEYMGEANKAAIVNRCRTVGRPYMYCMSNPNSFTDSELKEIVAAVHAEGCYIGSAGVYLAPDKSIRLKNLGFDFSASGCDVPYFENGNLLDICDDIDFSDVVTDGTITDNNIELANGQKVTISNNDTSLIKKYVLEVTFNGTLAFEVPRYTVPSATRTVTITSDGRQSIVFSGVKIKNAFMVYFTSTGNTTIYNISCKLSKC